MPDWSPELLAYAGDNPDKCLEYARDAFIDTDTGQPAPDAPHAAACQFRGRIACAFALRLAEDGTRYDWYSQGRRLREDGDTGLPTVACAFESIMKP